MPVFPLRQSPGRPLDFRQAFALCSLSFLLFLMRRHSFHCTHRHTHQNSRAGGHEPGGAPVGFRLRPEHSATPLRRLAEWSGATTTYPSVCYSVFLSIPPPAALQGGTSITP